MEEPVLLVEEVDGRGHVPDDHIGGVVLHVGPWGGGRRRHRGAVTVGVRGRAALLLGPGAVGRHDGVGAPALALLDILQGPLVRLGLHLNVTLPGRAWRSLGV